MKKLLLPSKIGDLGDLGDLVGRGTSALRLLRRGDKGQKAGTGAGAIDSPYFEEEVPPKDMSSPERSPWPSVLHSKSSKLVARLARERTGGIIHGAEGSKNGAAKAASPPESRNPRADGAAGNFSHRVVVRVITKEAKNDGSARDSPPPQPGGQGERQTLEPTQSPNDEVVPPKKAAASRTASGVEQPELIDSEGNPSREGTPNDVALQESFSIVSGLASAAKNRGSNLLKTYAGEDGSEASETSMQVLMRLLKSGMDFTTEFRERSHEESTIYSDVTSVPSGFPSRIENDATDDDHSFISELSLNDVHDMSMTEIDDNDDMGMVDAVCWQNENIVMFCGDGENIVVNDLVSNRSREEAE